LTDHHEARPAVAHTRRGALLMTGAVTLLQRLGIYLLLSSGLFYFAYKFYQPTYGGTDYFHYYRAYLHPLDLSVTEAPFVYRQVSAVLTNLVYRFGPYYDTQIFYSNPQFDQRVFFAAMLTNYLALGLCAAVTARITERLWPEGPPSAPLFAGALCYLSFFAQQSGMGPITDGVAWLMMALAFLGYVAGSLPTLAVVLALSIFEREILPIMIGVIAGMRLILSPTHRRFDLVTIGLCALAFGLYLGMRTLWAPVAGHEDQLRIGRSFVRIVRDWRALVSKDVIFQGFLSQNLLILTAVLLVWRRLRGRRAPLLAPQTGALMAGLWAAAAALVPIGFLTLHPPNSIGRIFAMLTPIAASLLAVLMFAKEAAPAPRPARIAA
jgi:hypothetical protein